MVQPSAEVVSDLDTLVKDKAEDDFVLVVFNSFYGKVDENVYLH